MAKAQILIVEDDGIVAMDIENRLKKFGYSVSGIANYAEKAIEKIEELKPDLVLMDIVPKGEMGGIEAAKIIRSRFDIPVIFFTACADEERLERAKLAIPFGYILKPFQDRDLKITIEMALYTTKVDAERRRAEEQAISQRALLEAINTVFQETLTSESDEEVAGACLEVAQRLTDSEFGWIGEINKDGRLDTIALSDPSWKVCRIPKDDSVKMIKNMKVRGIWSRTIIDDESQIVNDPASHPDSVGLPEGHPPITSFLGVPLKRAGKTIGMIALGNKSLGYRNSDQQNIEALSATFAEALHRKRAEEALGESEEHFRLAFNNAASGMALMANDGYFMQVNQTLCRILGYSEEELLGKTWVEITSSEDLDGCYDWLKQIKAGEQSAYEKRFIHKLGHPVWVMVSSSLVRDSQGRIRYYISLFQDIMSRKQAEEALRESEEKYRSMMEAMDDAAYICSPDFRIEYMNPAMTKRIGYDATGEPCNKVMYGLDEKCPWCIHGKVMKGEHVKTEVVSPKNGKTYHVSNSPIFHTDGSISKLTILRDVTEAKKMEELLQQSQKMESIGTLAGGIAHDFNNILFPMMGFAEMMLDDLPEDSLHRNNINEILQGTKRASDLVKQILAFSRQSHTELKPLKLQLVVKEVLKLMRSSLPSTIEIKQHISNKCGLVLADATQIHQVAMNLITNAFQAMEDEGGKLEVTLKEVELGLDDLTDQSMTPGTYVCLTMADTGPGMDQSVISRIFEPYFSTKENGKGTGLGLAVVHGIVKSYKGDIKVYSEPGEGTALHVYLPVIKTQVETEEADAVAPVPKGTERILLVDDEEPIVRMEKQMLERLGYQVTARTSSPDALEAFRAAPDKFDLVITDMTMPNMTGVRLSQKLLEIRPDIRIIICTGFSTKIDDEKAKEFGIREYVMKPVVMSKIAKKIREVLEKD